jgi:hypothetical protein
MAAIQATPTLADHEPQAVFQPQRSLWGDAWRRSIRNPFTVISALIIVFFLLAASI